MPKAHNEPTIVILDKKNFARMPVGPPSDLNFVEDAASSLTRISFNSIDADLRVQRQ
jgi:hypothetical protein